MRLTPATMHSIAADQSVGGLIFRALLAACKEARDELRHPDHTPGDWSVQVVLKQLDDAIQQAEAVQ